MQLLRNILSFCAGLAVAASNLDPSSYASSDVIYRDVAVIGGGSTGTYTAYRLREQNYSVAVIEPKNHLGGHAETYTAPNGWTIDIGVIVFAQTDTVKNYFQRFNVTLTTLSTGGRAQPRYIDFSTGEVVAGYQPPGQAAVASGLAAYAEQLQKYPYLNSGFNLTYPISSDSDLLLPFGQFVQKYNMTGAMQTIFVTNQGYAPLLDIPTLYMLKYLNADQLNSFAKGFLTTKNHDIQQLYQSVASYMGSANVFLNSTVVAMDRTSTPAKIMIQTPSGQKLIMAKKVVITAAPTLDNLQDIDLSPNETALFSQFFANGYYTGILTNTSLPANFSSEAAAPNPATYNIPTLPGVYSASANAGAPDHIQIYYGSPTVLSAEEAQANMVDSIVKVQRAMGLPATTPQWAIFSAHTPFNLMVTPAAIQDRFYEKLYALQGQNGTFWNGAAWDTQDSSVLWKFTDDFVVPMIVKSLA